MVNLTGETYIFSMDSDISGQNSLTMLSNLRNAKIFNSGIGSSRREMIPAIIKFGKLIKIENMTCHLDRNLILTLEAGQRAGFVNKKLNYKSW